ncbi:hypothetical protein RQP46_005249 [Phenoliferia psychrophenolica]
MVWSGNDGPVTRREIETALGMLANVAPVLQNHDGNILADGEFGQAAYNAGLLFELGGDRRALDFAVQFADKCALLFVFLMWTGKRELVWPTFPAPPDNTTMAQYAGSENGHIIGHLVNPALYILKSRCLWGLVPRAVSGPTAFTSNATYLTRALAFVKAADESIKYFIEWFLDNDLQLIQPNDPRWLLVGDAGNLPGAPMPWNRRMMIVHAFLRLAAAHETLPAYDPVRVWTYDNIARRNVRAFVASLEPSRSKSGALTFVWDYVAGKNKTEESQGIHGYYDIWGTWIAWQRSPWIYGVNDSTGERFANTFQFTINRHNGTFSGLVDGQSIPVKSPGVPGLWGGWSFYSFWFPAWFDTLATANVNIGFNERTWLSIPLLWTKNARALNSTAFWRGEFARGDGLISGTTAPSLTVQEVIRTKIRIGKSSAESLSGSLKSGVRGSPELRRLLGAVSCAVAVLAVR